MFLQQIVELGTAERILWVMHHHIGHTDRGFAAFTTTPGMHNPARLFVFNT